MQVLAQQQWRGVKLPKEALYIIRYHSLYAWHDKGEYEALESEYDRNMKGWVRAPPARPPARSPARLGAHRRRHRGR